jgi:hypothetical protein
MIGPFQLAFIALAASSGGEVPESAILSQAKQDSKQFCSAGQSCEYFAMRTKEGWNVRTTLVFITAKRERAYSPGGFSVYVYSPLGKLLRVEPGL